MCFHAWEISPLLCCHKIGQFALMPRSRDHCGHIIPSLILGRHSSFLPSCLCPFILSLCNYGVGQFALVPRS